jgi:hypothetical protein
VERFRQGKATRAKLVSGWADRLLSPHGWAGLQGALREERSRLGTWWPVARQLGPVEAELARRVAATEISAVERQIAGERLNRAVEQCSATVATGEGAPSALLVRPEFDHVRLGLALVELCAGDLGWSTLVAGAVAAVDLRHHLEQRAPSAVVLAAGRDCDPAKVDRYVSVVQADCKRLGIPCVLVGDAAEAPGLFGGDGNALEALRVWLQQVQATLVPAA